MTDYVAILETETDAGAPGRSSLWKRWAKNPVAIAEGAPGAPKVVGRGLDFDIGNISGTTVFTNLATAAKIALVATIELQAASGVSASGTIRYRLSSNNGATWGGYVTITQGYIYSATGSNKVTNGGATIIAMGANNAIELSLSGSGTAGGCLFVVEGN